jgi:putative phosphoribosyl transferase
MLISFRIAKTKLEGELIIPSEAKSLVIFSHGSGSSRFSTRNIFVAKALHQQKIGTFLFDLLTKDEDELYTNRFNIELLTQRLILATKYIAELPRTAGLTIGYFGASTGAASALGAAAELPEIIKAVVSRGGRPDLALEAASKVKAPTLLIVGEKDYDVLDLNKEVYRIMKCEKKLKVIQGATHLFEEEGTLQQAAELASEWFNTYLKSKELLVVETIQ